MIMRGYIENLCRLAQSIDTLPSTTKYSLKSAETYVRLPSSEDLVMFVARIIFLLRERIARNDQDYFTSDKFKRDITRLVSVADFNVDETLMSDLRGGIQGFFEEFSNNILKLRNTTFGKVITLRRVINDIIEQYPFTVDEYLNNGLTPPFSNLS